MNALLSRATLIGSSYSSSPDENVIINGGMDIWQRGTTANYAAGTNGKLADRWHVFNVTNGGAVTVNQITTNLPPVTSFCPLLNYALEIDITTADSGADAGDLGIIRYNVEGYDFLRLAQQPMVLSFWVKATVTGQHYVTLFNQVPDRHCIMPYTIVASDTWEYKTVIIPASPSGGTWNYTNSIGMMINFVLCAGSTYTTGAVVGSWQTGGLYAASDVVNDFSSTSNFFRLTGVSLRAGIVPKPFVKRHYNLEKLLCARYFERIPLSISTIINTIQAASNTVCRGKIEWSQPKRIAPSVTFGAGVSDFYISFPGPGTDFTPDTLGASGSPNLHTAGISSTRAAGFGTLAAGDSALVRTAVATYIDIDADL